MKELSNKQLYEFCEISQEIINAKGKESKRLRVKYINKAMSCNLIEFNSVEDLKKSHGELYKEASDKVSKIIIRTILKGLVHGLKSILEKRD